MDWLTAILGGVIGAVVGSGLTLWGERQRTANERRGAGRALRAEMERNAVVLEMGATDSELSADPTDATWLSTQSDIALYLSRADFALVAAPYQLLPILLTIVRRGRENGEPEGWEAAQMRDTAGRFRDGVAVLTTRDEASTFARSRARLGRGKSGVSGTR